MNKKLIQIQLMFTHPTLKNLPTYLQSSTLNACRKLFVSLFYFPVLLLCFSSE